MAGPKPRTLPSSRQCQESSNQRPSPSCVSVRNQSLQYLGVPSGSLTSSCIPYTALDLDAPRPSSNVECPWSCSRYALQNTLRESACWLALHALQLGQSPAGWRSASGGFSRGRSSFRVAPRVLSYGSERHAWQKDRSVRSQGLRSSVASLSECSSLSPRIPLTLCLSGTVSFKCLKYFHIQALLTSAVAILSTVPRLQGLVVRSDSSTPTNRTPVLAAAPLRTSQRKEPRPASTLRPHFSRWRVFALPPSRLTHITQYPRCATTEKRAVR